MAQQRLHDQLNALCPGLSAPVGHGKGLAVEGVTGQAVLDCGVYRRAQVEDSLIQPVAADTVADVVESPLGPAGRTNLSITGPEVIRLPISRPDC
jgi:hypothetical protein